MRVHSESEKWTKTSNLEPNRTEPRSQWNVSKEGDGSAQYFIFLKCQFMYLKDTLSKHTHTQTHTHTGTGNAMASCSVQLVNGRNGFLTDLWLSSPSLPHFWIIAIEIDERNFVFLSPSASASSSSVTPSRQHIEYFGLVSVWIHFEDSVRAAPLLTGQEKEARLWQVSFQCRAASYLGHEKGLL